jgi:DNA invertase Pin-like site-specific DNA recombinase
MKVAIYARVSKERCNRDGCGHLYSEHVASGRCAHQGCNCPEYQGQDPENQLVELRRYATAQGWEIVEYVDRATGTNTDRDALQEVFQHASRKKFDVVLAWSLDRLTREGPLPALLLIKRFTDYGVQFESYSEPFFRTTGPAGELLVPIFAWIAKQERQRISDRTKAGLARAKSKGRIGGRPAKVFDRERAMAWRNEDPKRSWRWISRELGVAQSSIRDALAGVRETSSRKHQRRVALKR